MKLPNTPCGGSISFKRKLYTLVLLSLAFGVAILLIPYPTKLLPQFLLGAMFAHSIELLHELNHRKQFLNDFLNQWVAVLLGLPMLTSASLYKFLHGLHHKFLGTPEDTESFSYDYNQVTTFRGFILHLSIFNHYLTSLGCMQAAVFDAMDFREDMPFQVRSRVRSEFRLMAYSVTFMLVLSILLQTKFFLDIWFIPLILGAGPAHALIELPEHIGCDSTTTDICMNTRTIKAGRFAEWYTNGNCFHVEHHLNPGWEISRLRELHAQATSTSRIENLEDSYIAFYSKVLVMILRNSFEQKF